MRLIRPTRGSRGAPVVAAVVLVLGLVAGLVLAVSLAPDRADAGALTNLDHLDLLGDDVEPPSQPGHTTYALDAEPEIGMLWTYAEPDADGVYEGIGGGDHAAAANTYTQGAFNADDVSRAAIVYLRHWRQHDDADSRERAYQLLRGLAYLQTVEGEHAGNVVLWMQPDGTLNPSPEPVELPDPSDSGPSYWLARTIWALGEGYAAFVDEDPEFAAFLGERMNLATDALDRQVLAPSYGEHQVVDGLRWPAWLVVDGADGSAEAMYGLTAFVEAGGGDDATVKALSQLGEGVASMQLGDATTWPFGALMPWTESRVVWHAWGDQMTGAVTRAADVADEPSWVELAAGSAATSTSHLLAQGGPDHSWSPTPAERTQIAYGADATLQNLLRLHEATGEESFAQLAGIAGSWFFGNNPAGEPLYDPASGRTFDGVAFDGTINANAGAESTIHGLLAMLALDAAPEIAARVRDAERVEHVTWELYEAEDGALDGDASVTEPEEAWTGESAWSGSYVELGEGGAAVLDVELPEAGPYLVMPVFDRQEVAAGRVATSQRLGGSSLGVIDHGGAGAQGVTAVPGYLDMATTEASGSLEAGATQLEITHTGQADELARLDAAYVVPLVEWIVLDGPAGGQGLLRSFSASATTRTVTLPGAAEVTATAYDGDGIARDDAQATGGTIDAPIEPGGFTILTGTP